VPKELTDFLEGEAPLEADPPVADTPQTPDSDAPLPVADEAKPDAPEATAPGAPDPPDPDGIPEDIRGLRSALQAERGKRNDYKGDRDRLSGELAATKAALAAAEAKAAAAATPAPAPPAVVEPQEPPVVPNPLEDPAGYHAHMQRMMFNERLNLSEALLRETPGVEKVDEKLAAFRKAADANPALRSELSRQSHPYRWAYDQGAKLMALAEVGDDPVAFRAKVEAEMRAAVRAEIEAELAGTAPAKGAVEAVVIPRSLASATSSAPRMAAVEPPPEFEDVFKPRKRA
jgi:hypothetical protein